jgi:signal transduction histidine kinase
VTDSVFYKNQYDTNAVLGNLSKIMASTLRLDDVTHGILRELGTQIHITKSAFILMKDGFVTDVNLEGFKHSLSIDDKEMKVINKTHGTLVFDELEEGSKKKILRKYNISVVAHLRSKGRQIGLLVLGEKSSGDIYSDQDLKLIEILASEAAVAIENALAFEEIRRFNITLKEEIDKATSQLKLTNEKLEYVDKLKDEFVSLASHELRTPMTAIKSYTWLIINNKAGPLEEKAKEYLNRIYASTERLLRLVNEMLNISRIESGRVRLQKERIDVKQFIEDIEKEFKPKAEELGLTWSVEMSPSLPHITVDQEKIRQVFENLIDNAFKYTPRDGAVRIRALASDEHVEFSVTDTGKGIHPEDIPKLFSKFGRLEGSYITITGSGSGLGLYISKQYVQLHKGKIWAYSEVGKGATFVFSIPIQ